MMPERSRPVPVARMEAPFVLDLDAVEAPGRIDQGADVAHPRHVEGSVERRHPREPNGYAKMKHENLV